MPAPRREEERREGAKSKEEKSEGGAARSVRTGLLSGTKGPSRALSATKGEETNSRRARLDTGTEEPS